MKMSKFLMTLGIFVALSACTTLKTPTFADDMGAIRGFDPVAYHAEQMPVKGDPAYTHTYNDGVWYFSNAENLEKFRNDPQRYAPAYGGYCAYAMSRNLVVSIDPEAWTIVDNKLYLNYSLGTRKRWLEDVPGYVAKADANWREKTSQQVFE